jgi:hypothetical protein
VFGLVDDIHEYIVENNQLKERVKALEMINSNQAKIIKAQRERIETQKARIYDLETDWH